ncbi:MAG: hypothetical protein DMG60_13690 [Acidobacteria bacterium]|nr:MAG: hypothetical protein DMG60_13690 [Acidobacteriota bacterium]
MSNKANSDRDDKFFPARGEDNKPKAPGAFTSSFMGTGNDSDSSAATDPKVPKSPIPFTAQFGSAAAFAPATESPSPSPVTELPGIRNQQPASSAGAFTRMFAPETAAKSQSPEPPTEITRVFERTAREATNSSPQTPRASGFTEMFGSSGPSAPVQEAKKAPLAPTPLAPTLSEFKPAGFTELFKPQSPGTQSAPAAEAPLSPLSAQPATGRFTELFKGESISREAPTPPPTPFSGTGTGGFTEFFRTPSSAPASTPPAANAPAETAPGGFTQLFKGSAIPSKGSPVSPKPAGELTQMISGGSLAPQQPPAASPGAVSQAGATRLFTAGTDAPAMAPLPAGPSEYTRIVSPRQLKDLQQTTSVLNNAAQASQTPGGAGVPPVPNWPNLAAPPMAGAAPVAPQLGAPLMPPAAPPWQVQVPQHPPFVAQPPQPPNMGKALPTLPAVAPNQGSKILTYLPLIIGLNVLFLIAVLFILLFALKR